MHMTIHERISTFRSCHADQMMQDIQRIGNYYEIVNYINAMPVICQEVRGTSCAEVRMNQRLIVHCKGKNIRIVATSQVRQYYLCQNVSFEDGGCDMVLQTDWGSVTLTVSNRDSVLLLRLLQQYCPEFSPAVLKSAALPIRKLQDGRSALVFTTHHIFRPDEFTLVLLEDILGCSIVQESDGDGGFDCYLRLHLRDGSHRQLPRSSADDCYACARKLKHYAPHVRYRLAEIHKK